MDADGSHVRQLCFDQDHNYHPTVLSSGQVLYQRWDYTGISHIYLRQLMTMNPDGTSQCLSVLVDNHQLDRRGTNINTAEIPHRFAP